MPVGRDTPTDRLLGKLQCEGYQVTCLVPARGYWRRQDVHRWEAWAVREEDGAKVCLYSWSTITACARRGFTVELPDQHDPLSIEIVAP